jgi:hypothetical protein
VIGTLDKGKYIYKRKSHLLVREDVNIRTIIAKVQLKKSLVVGLKLPDAKTN